MQYDVYLICGQNGDAAQVTASWLRALGLKVLTWAEAQGLVGKPSPSVELTSKAAFAAATAYVAVLTGDDSLYLAEQFLAPTQRNVQVRPAGRPNVFIEIGMALASDTNRTIIIQLGNAIIPPELYAHTTIVVAENVDETQLAQQLHEIARRLETMCKVTWTGDDWLQVTPFIDLLAVLQERRNSITVSRGSSIILTEVEGDYARIQDSFIRKITETTQETHKRVSIYGFTLAVFWPRFRDAVLTREGIRNWTFDLFMISPAFVQCHPEFFDEIWRNDSVNSLNAISLWMTKNNKRLLSARDINLRIMTYNLVPFVHGKKWADGTIFFHLACWKTMGEGLDYPNTFHDIISPEDTSERAAAYRRLFNNWVVQIEWNVDEHIGL